MSSWWDSTGIDLSQPQAWGGNATPGLVDPSQRQMAGTAAPAPMSGTPPAGGAPQAGQWAPTNQGFLDWATKNFGADANSFVKLPQGQQFQDVLKRYTQETGNQATFQGGPSGDRVDFGQGTQDALTSSGQIWRDEGRGGTPGGSYTPTGSAQGWTEGGGSQTSGHTGYGGYGGGPTGGPSSMTMPTAPTATNIQAPGAFSAPGLGTLSQFGGGGGAVPTAPTLGYTPMTAPTSQTAQQVEYQNATAPGLLTADRIGAPQSLTYNPATTPTAFAGDRQAQPGTLSYQNMATPAGYEAERYHGLNAADLETGPAADAYKWRTAQGQQALENSAASKGVLRTGNTAKGLIDYGQGAASQEYAAADARARSTNAMNNATSLGAYQTNAQTGLAYGQENNRNALNFGQQNIQNAFNANEANYGRSANEAQQGFQNANTVNQQNNQGALAYGAQNFQQGAAATQANNAANLAYGQQNFNAGNTVTQQNNAGNANATIANNAANLAYGGQNFQNQFATNQANNQGQFQTGQANFANQMAAQGQGYGQAANTYGMNLGAQQQGYGQAAQTYGMNAANTLAYGQANQNNQLANYQAQVNAALGLGNLNLGFQNSGNAYTLGQGQLALGNTQAANAYSLGQGNLGLGQDQLGLQRAFGTYDRNYAATVTDPFRQAQTIAGSGGGVLPGGPQ